jgi:hypothetical protein
VLVMLLPACGGEDGGQSSCSPAPAITSIPPTQAAVDQQYRYQVEFRVACVLVCGDELRLLQSPPGAGVDHIRRAVFWSPAPSHRNTTVTFTLATPIDACGNRATQTWSVTVQS